MSYRCIHCDRLATVRGCCRRCYADLYNKVRKGVLDWRTLIVIGHILPCKPKCNINLYPRNNRWAATS